MSTGWQSSSLQEPPPGGGEAGPTRQQGRAASTQSGSPQAAPPGRPQRPGGFNLLAAVARGDRSLQGNQFQMASLVQDAWERLQEEPSYVLQKLGGQDSCCLQAVEEICRTPCTTTVG